MQFIYDTYNKRGANPTRIDTTTDFEEAHQIFQNLERLGEYAFTIIEDGLRPAVIYVFKDNDDWEQWRIKLERDYAWKPHVKPESILDKATPLPTTAHSTVEDDGFHVKHPNEPVDTIEFIPTSPVVNVMSKKKVDAINPPHYQGYVEDSGISLQWLETMCRIPRFKEHPNEFIAALELQIRKYLDRAGRKDEDFQELQKGLWYYKFMVAYIKNGSTPILVSEVDRILLSGK